MNTHDIECKLKCVVCIQVICIASNIRSVLSSHYIVVQ